MATAETLNSGELKTEVERRRNFAIVSHPDAGKTTLTEKLLLYGGAIHEAGAVKARRSQKQAISDWMAMEQQRGISITSTVLQFLYKDYQVNLLDTPGHADFSEDTYRTLSAVDNAVMLIDAAKGLEPRTRKLFEVCRRRRLPIFTFANKMDRPTKEPLELLDEIEQELGMDTYAVNWPIGQGDRFTGVFDRLERKVHLFERSTHGRKAAEETVFELDDPRLEELIDPELYEQFREELEILDELGGELDAEVDVLVVHHVEQVPTDQIDPIEDLGVEAPDVVRPVGNRVAGFAEDADLVPKNRVGVGEGHGNLEGV